jgi:hypothetical protein
MKRIRTLLVIVALAGLFSPVAANEPWRTSPIDAQRGAAVRLGAPAVRQAPLAIPARMLALEDLGAFQRHIVPISHRVDKPAGAGVFTSTSAFAGPPSAGEEQYNCGVITEGPLPPGVMPDAQPSFWDRLFGRGPGCEGCGPTGSHPWTSHPWLGGPGAMPYGSAGAWTFRSDHEFDYMISPVTNPFFFEDPRSLTELRPVFIWQPTPKDNPATYGGTAFALTFQGRLALTERWSIVISRLGVARVTVNDPPTGFPASPFSSSTGFMDIQFGPKYTFYRDPSTGTIAAVGIDFTAPTGSNKVFQGNEWAMTPYISAAQRLGDFNLMGGAGYRFGFGSKTADFFFLSGHLDYNFANKFYPLVEMNWYRYTNNGNQFPGNFGGADLFDTGSSAVKNTDLLTIALGARYKFSEAFQVGAAYELPLVGKDQFYRWRITFDMIFRY